MRIKKLQLLAGLESLVGRKMFGTKGSSVGGKLCRA